MHTCISSNGLKRSWRSCPRRVNAGNKKHTQHALSTKTECDYLNGWIKKRSHTQKSHPKVVNPRDIAGERQKKNKNKTKQNKKTQKLSNKTSTITINKITAAPPAASKQNTENTAKQQQQQQNTNKQTNNNNNKQAKNKKQNRSVSNYVMR